MVKLNNEIYIILGRWHGSKMQFTAAQTKIKVKKKIATRTYSHCSFTEYMFGSKKTFVITSTMLKL